MPHRNLITFQHNKLSL